jgi:hypothetical protein
MDKSSAQHFELDQTSESGDTLNVPKHESGPQILSNADTAEAIEGLSQEHRDYLLQVHGTLDLDPIPAMDDADPYNWPMWKVSPQRCVDEGVLER